MSGADIIWAETDWHCWWIPVGSYLSSEADDHEPRWTHNYQPNHRTHTMHSVLTDAHVQELEGCIQRGEKLMRWRLQHFSDRHTTELEHLLNAGALTEPDLSSVGLAILAHRHWMEMDNPQVAGVLVRYMLRLHMTPDEVVDELMQENSMSGEDRDEKFAAFVGNCAVKLRHERLAKRLPEKANTDVKKVKL